MKTSITFMEFIRAIVIILIMSIIVSIALGVGLELLGHILPTEVFLTTAVIGGTIASFYPLYYGLDYACNLCGSA